MDLKRKNKTKQDVANLVCEVYCVSLWKQGCLVDQTAVGPETNNSSLSIIMEKLPEENSEKYFVADLWLLCEKLVRN